MLMAINALIYVSLVDLLSLALLMDLLLLASGGPLVDLSLLASGGSWFVRSGVFGVGGT